MIIPTMNMSHHVQGYNHSSRAVCYVNSYAEGEGTVHFRLDFEDGSLMGHHESVFAVSLLIRVLISPMNDWPISHARHGLSSRLTDVPLLLENPLLLQHVPRERP